jgi:hypothetical protein
MLKYGNKNAVHLGKLTVIYSEKCERGHKDIYNLGSLKLFLKRLEGENR